MDWQPIETAPKDGTPLVLVRAQGKQSHVVFTSGLAPDNPIIGWTHWIPAPSDSEEAGRAEEER